MTERRPHVPQHLRLTAAQRAMLENELCGRSLFFGLEGRSAHGGAHHTMQNLLRRGLLRRDGGLSAEGHAALLLEPDK